MVLGQDAVQQRGLARAEIAGKNVDGNSFAHRGSESRFGNNERMRSPYNQGISEA